MEDLLTRQARVLKERLAACYYAAMGRAEYWQWERLTHAHIRASSRYGRRRRAHLDTQYIRGVAQ